MKYTTPPMTAAELLAQKGGMNEIQRSRQPVMLETIRMGDWVGGPAWLVSSAKLDPEQPEIVGIVRLAYSEAPHDQPPQGITDEVVLYGWEQVLEIAPGSYPEAILVSNRMVAEYCRRELFRETDARRDALKAAKERWANIVPRECTETQPGRLPGQARAYWPQAREYRPERGVTIMGATGTGKSRVAARMLLACAERGASIHWLSCAEIRTRMLASIDGASRIFNQATSARVLCLDDIGHGLGMEQADALLLSILTNRANARKITIATTQYSAAGMISRFASQETGEAVVRRIGQQYATPVDFGRDNQGGQQP